MPSGKSVLIGAVVVFFILFALDLVVREYRPRKPMSKVAVVFALLVVPLIAIPLTLIGDKVVSELGVSLRVRDVILLSALALPALLSIWIAAGAGQQVGSWPLRSRAASSGWFSRSSSPS